MTKEKVQNKVQTIQWLTKKDKTKYKQSNDQRKSKKQRTNKAKTKEKEKNKEQTIQRLKKKYKIKNRQTNDQRKSTK
jgi:hypothetical protein